MSKIRVDSSVSAQNIKYINSFNLETKFYNQIEFWDKYKNNMDETVRAEVTVNLIPKEVTSVLDVGCGNGTVTNMINRSFVVGLDIVRTPLTELKNHAIQGIINMMPIKPKKIDLILLTEVLEHLDDEMYSEAISEIKRLESEYILITVPSDEDLKLDLCKCSVCGNLFNINHHYRVFDKDNIQREFPEYNVTTIKYETYRIYPNRFLIKIKQTFGVYAYAKDAVCNKCGASSIRPNNSLRYIFGGLNRLDRLFKRCLRRKKPYHLMILLKRKTVKVSEFG